MLLGPKRIAFVANQVDGKSTVAVWMRPPDKKLRAAIAAALAKPEAERDLALFKTLTAERVLPLVVDWENVRGRNDRTKEVEAVPFSAEKLAELVDEAPAFFTKLQLAVFQTLTLFEEEERKNSEASPAGITGEAPSGAESVENSGNSESAS